nr:immunoglobulin light chain junction region [Mus musculus]
CQHFWDTPFTF